MRKKKISLCASLIFLFFLSFELLKWAVRSAVLSVSCPSLLRFGRSHNSC